MSSACRSSLRVPRSHSQFWTWFGYLGEAVHRVTASGNDEVRIVDETQTVVEFINQIAVATSDFIGEVLPSERAEPMESETLSVSEEREYSYGEARFPTTGGDNRR